jgi:phosphate:Na+ symporter
METFHHILKLSAGVGLFFCYIFTGGIFKNLSGGFKLFLQRITKECDWRRYRGAIVTGILQSSSMVSFMVLALWGAGVFEMRWLSSWVQIWEQHLTAG